LRKLLLIVMGILPSVSCAPKEKSQYDWKYLEKYVIEKKSFSSPPNDYYEFTSSGKLYKIYYELNDERRYEGWWKIDDEGITIHEKISVQILRKHIIVIL